MVIATIQFVVVVPAPGQEELEEDVEPPGAMVRDGHKFGISLSRERNSLGHFIRTTMIVGGGEEGERAGNQDCQLLVLEYPGYLLSSWKEGRLSVQIQFITFIFMATSPF